MSYKYSYPRPSLTVDAILFTHSGNQLKVLLIQRGIDPFKNHWAFPGGFVNENEPAEEAILREVKEEVSLTVGNLKQLHAASAPGRDPRGWTVSVFFIGFVEWDNSSTIAGDDAINAKWFPLNSVPRLAFDHKDQLSLAKKYLKQTVRQSVIDKSLLPSVFLLEQLHSIYFEITGSSEETDVLILRLINMSVVIPDAYQDLYRFNESYYDRIINSGFHQIIR